MTALADILGAFAPQENHRPWPRYGVTRQAWSAAAAALGEGRATLLDLWGEAGAVAMAVMEEAAGEFAVLALDCPDRRFPSVARSFAPASRLERAIADLYGTVAEDAPDSRPWLDHGRWGVRAPLGAARPVAGEAAADAYPFLAAEGESLHRIPVGPVHAGIIEPGHFRFTAGGEAVVRLEARLGYVHKGIDALMQGAEIERAARLAGRISGDSTVAYAWAFAGAVEAALGLEVPPRAQWLRALAAELERIANHFGDIGAVCNDASFVLMHAHCGALREEVLRASGAGFGHRLMMDRVVPGGVAADLAVGGEARLRRLVADARRDFPELVELYDNTASLQDRTVATGILKPELARRFGAGGFVGRASGRAFDARRSPGYAPYDRLDFEVPGRDDGDVNARVWIRIHEVEASLGLIERILEGLPGGEARVPLPAAGGAATGMALIEGFRGDVFACVRLEGARVAACRLRDPSWFQWPLLEAAIEGNIVADFPLCNKSFNCSYSGHDL